MEETEKEKGDRLITEAELLKVLDLKKSDLDNLRREKGFPFVKFSQRKRAYFLSDVMEWAKKHRVTPEEG
jgi:predicted DNA-binding transcriptional regulator AlpA